MLAVVEHRQHHVLQRVGARQQVIGLEDEANTPVADRGQLHLIQIADILPGQDIAPASWMIQAAQDVHQGAFPGSGGSHDGDKFTLLDFQVNTIQRLNLNISHTVDLYQVDRLDDRRFAHCMPPGFATSPIATASPAANPSTICAEV